MSIPKKGRIIHTKNIVTICTIADIQVIEADTLRALDGVTIRVQGTTTLDKTGTLIGEDLAQAMVIVIAMEDGTGLFGSNLG